MLKDENLDHVTTHHGHQRPLNKKKLKNAKRYICNRRRKERKSVWREEFKETKGRGERKKQSGFSGLVCI